MKNKAWINPLSIPAAALTVFLLLALVFIPALAQESQVNAVLFYSPTCGHCEKVINEELPPLLEKFGSNLNIVGINVSIQQGQELYKSAIERFEIPEEKLGVPCLIVGETVLVGSLEIPEQFPGIIENGISQGGFPYPISPDWRKHWQQAGNLPQQTRTIRALHPSAKAQKTLTL